MAHTVQCPSCSTEFPVDPAKVPEDGVNARCSSCAEVFFVEKPGGSTEASGGVVAPESPVEMPREESPEAPAFEEAGEEDDLGIEAPAFEETGEGEDLGFESPAAVEEEEAESPAFEMPPEEEEEGEEVEIAEEDFVLEQETLYTEEGEEAEAPEATGEIEIEGGDGEPALEEPPEEEAAPAETPSGEAPEGLAGTGEAPKPGPVQFGQRSPEDKAQRLARVLVSDMILYNPQRHTRAIESGTLADEFEDEIKKSWEEYVDQVGEELAESTAYFTDALNEILAKGEEIF